MTAIQASDEIVVAAPPADVWKLLADVAATPRSGRGEWRLEPSGSGTRVRYELDVQAAGRVVAWIGRVIPLGRLHSRQMQGVLRRLERELA